MSLLIIRNMHYSSSHDYMHLPYPTFLTHVFRYFGVLTDKDMSVQLFDYFDSKTLLASHLQISYENKLFYGSSHGVYPGHPSSPGYNSDHTDQDLTSVLNSLFEKVYQNSIIIESIQKNMSALESFSSLTSQFSILHANHQIFVKLDVLRVHDKKLAQTVDFEFGTLQEGMQISAKSWEKEYVKLFFKLGSETQFITKQLSTMQDK